MANWRVNPGGLFYTGEVIHWSLVWQTLSSWLWPLWVMFLALGYVGMVTCLKILHQIYEIPPLTVYGIKTRLLVRRTNRLINIA